MKGFPFNKPLAKTILYQGWYADRSGKPHQGMDFKADHDPVYAVASGTVAYSARNLEGGNTIAIHHDGIFAGFGSRYLHLDSRLVEVGDYVKQGQQIGVSGNTGTLTAGPHLHFDMQATGDPLALMRSVDPVAVGYEAKGTSGYYNVPGELFIDYTPKPGGVYGDFWDKGAGVAPTQIDILERGLPYDVGWSLKTKLVVFGGSVVLVVGAMVAVKFVLLPRLHRRRASRALLSRNQVVDLTIGRRKFSF
jgi:hypothetical protein